MKMDGSISSLFITNQTSVLIVASNLIKSLEKLMNRQNNMYGCI